MGPRDTFFDLVQVQSSFPNKNDEFGSGRIVRPGLVLTALHCVADENTWEPASKVEVYLWRDLNEKIERAKSATIVWPRQLPPVGKPPDIAVLKLDDPNTGLDTPLSYAVCPMDELIAWTAGFPGARKASALVGGRGEASLPGTCATLAVSDPTIVFKSTIALGEGNTEKWKGLSGGPLVVGQHIVGVMRAMPEEWSKTDQLEAEPLGQLLRGDPHLRQLLGVDLPLPVAQNSVAAALPPEFRKLTEIIHFFNRNRVMEEVLDAIGIAAGDGCSVEIVAFGRDVDRCDDLATRVDEQALTNVLEHKTSGLRRISWPDSQLDPPAAVAVLCRAAARGILLRPPWASTWDEIVDLMQKWEIAPWFHLTLPAEPTALDLHLVAEWRRCWAGIRRKPGEPAGYIFTFDGTAENAAGLETVFGPRLNGLRPITLRLGSHSIDDVSRWPSDIHTLSLQKVLRSDRPKELQILARSLEPHLVGRGWHSFSQRDLHWLLEGQG
jgi:hypothetical protein